MKCLTEYTDRELLKEFNRIVNDYISARDDELEFLDDHPNRDFWDDEQDAEYDSIMDDINKTYDEYRKIKDFIGNLK